MRRVISLLLIAVILFTGFAAASAANEDEKKIDNKKDELGQVNKDIENTKQQLQQVRQDQAKVAAQLQSIEDQIQEKEDELSQIEKKLEDTQVELASTRDELAKAIEEAQSQQTLMAERIRSIYMNNTTSYLQLLFEAKSLNDFLDRLEMVRQLVSYDQQVLNDMQSYRDQVDEKKSLLEDEEKDISETKDQITQQKADIENKKKEREKLLSQLEDQQEEYEGDLNVLEQTSKDLEKKIQQMLKELEEKKRRAKYTGGVMTWPVPGFYRITSQFGYRIHPIYKTKKYHSGIDIGSNYENGTRESIYGQNFVAGANGTVLFAGVYGGYGNCVIIDHGGGITSLYAHGSKILVRQGQSVRRGQPVLKVGSSGVSTGAHAHFEIRKNGTPVNPMNYLK